MGVAVNTQTFADWSTWTGPFAELQQINQEAAEKAIREYISYYSDNAACAVKGVQNMQRVSNPEELLSTQMKLLAQHGEKTANFFASLGKIWQDVVKEHYDWSQHKVNSAIKTATKGAKKDLDD